MISFLSLLDCQLADLEHQSVAMEKNESILKTTDSGPESSPSGKEHEVTEGSTEILKSGAQALRRRLHSKEVQMYCMGTTIGTCKAIILVHLSYFMMNETDLLKHCSFKREVFFPKVD